MRQWHDNSVSMGTKRNELRHTQREDRDTVNVSTHKERTETPSMFLVFVLRRVSVLCTPSCFCAYIQWEHRHEKQSM